MPMQNEGYITFQVSTPIEISANADNLPIIDYGNNILINATAESLEVTGFLAPTTLEPGALVTFEGLIKATGNDLILKHNVSSAAGNRIFFDNEVDNTLPAGRALPYFYNGVYFMVSPNSLF